MTVDELTDRDIEKLEALAVLTDDIAYVNVCRMAYNHNGRGMANHTARMRVAAAITELRSIYREIT